MAALKTASKKSPTFLDQLKTAIIETLKANGIRAKVDSEPVPTTKLYRLAVVAPQFTEMKHYERQSLIWRIVEHTLRPEDQMRISMILTLTDKEAKGK